jgi:hypothetical protein
MEDWWNNTDRGNTKYSEKNLPHCYFIHHKLHMDRVGIETGLHC